MRRVAFPDFRVSCIGVASSLGAPFSGTARAPGVLREAGLTDVLLSNGAAAEWHDIGAVGDDLGSLLNSLAGMVAEAVSAGDRLLVIGGDHSIAAGTWRGVGTAGGEAPGLIWIDAHLDAHTPASSPSGNRHGMPLAALLGEGEPAMIDVPGPALDPARLAVIGIRSHEAEELARLAAHGVRIFRMDEVFRRGLAAVLQDAWALMGGRPWGLTLDLDAIEPADFPAVATPADDGISLQELTVALRGLLRRPDCVGCEIVEYNPAADPGGASAAAILDLVDSLSGPDGETLRRWEKAYGANNYDPLPVSLKSGRGVWLHDVDGRRYLDMMSAYSATSFGHAHPRLLRTMARQASRLAVTSRAYGNDRLPQFLRRLALLTGYERVLPVNTGLEAVETAIKVARKWAYKVKGVADGQAEIIACDGNFHGRSVTIVGLSSETQYRDGFGPFPAGLKRIPYGDAAALEAAITPATAAFLVEPIQGEGGIILPPPGYLTECAEICRRHGVLLIADEIQTGLGRTGRLLACEHEGVRPDAVILGKALGGGLLPVSAFLADQRVMGVLKPGDHGSTFGGNPLACAVAMTALDILEQDGLVEHAAALGEYLIAALQRIADGARVVRAVRGRGLFAGIEVIPAADARQLAEMLLDSGVLTKDTHATVLRLAPPLIIGQAELAWALERIETVLQGWEKGRLAA